MNLGPNISTDDLVLYLDAANVDSFRGEPTTNLLYDNGVINWTIGNLTVTVSRTTVIENSVYRITSGNFVNQFTSGSFRFYVPLVKLTNGATYTMSYKWRLISGGPTFSMNDWCDTSLSNVVNLNFGDYNYASATGTRSTYDSTFRFMDFNMSPFTTVEIYDVQLEQKNYSTPFVNGTRGTTVATGGGVADISNNNNHAEFLASTFDSSNLGSIVFDGTDDYLAISDNTNTNLSTTDFSISFWIKVPNVSQNGPIIYKRNPNSPFDQYGVSIGDTETDSGFTTLSSKKILVILRGNNSNQVRIVTEEDLINSANGNWFKIDVVRFSNSLKIYYNGSEKNTITRRTDGVGILSNISVTGQELRVGGSNSSTFMTGQLSSVKIYNRALSTDEIQQNFNATKTRFGL
jgi:hypothetical protein